LNVKWLLHAAQILDPPPDKNGERRVGGEFLLLFKALNKALTAEKFWVPFNLVGSDGKGKRL
jgi:hypothetical protein